MSGIEARGRNSGQHEATVHESRQLCTVNHTTQALAGKDLIRPIDSEWNSALLSVAKKNTVAKSFVIGLWPLNAKYKKINLYIGSVEQNLQKLHSIKVVSAIDMSNGFGVLPITEEDQHYFVFTMPNQGS